MTNEEQIDFARRAGIRRGINASIKSLETLRELHSKRSSGYNDLTIAIGRLQDLDINKVEEGDN